MGNFIAFNQTNIYYETYGDSKDPAIIMLHPAFSDHHTYMEQIEGFRSDYYLILVDMIGHGKSQLSKANVTMGDMPEILAQIIDQEACEKVHVLGCSLGSLIGQGFAHYYPERILSVTVIGGYSIHKNNDYIAKAQRKEMGKWLFYIILSMNRFRKYIADVSAYTTKGKDIMLKGAMQYSRRSFRAMQGMDRIMIKKETPVSYPLLVSCGEYDLLLAKKAGKLMANTEANAQYIEIKKAGHLANLDNSENFNEVYKRFLHKVAMDK